MIRTFIFQTEYTERKDDHEQAAAFLLGFLKTLSRIIRWVGLTPLIRLAAPKVLGLTSFSFSLASSGRDSTLGDRVVVKTELLPLRLRGGGEERENLS